MRPGRSGVLATEAYSFEFEPSYGEKNDTLYFNGDLNARAVAALRLARELHLLTDRREELSLKLDGTGFEGALDGVIACSNGESGWWGKGVSGGHAEREEKPVDKLNPEGFWAVEADQENKTCTATAKINSRETYVLFTASEGDISFGVATGSTLRRGSKGVFETEAYSFQFTPSYDDNYLYLDDAMSDRSLAALRLARRLVISVDRRTVADIKLEGTGLDAVLTNIADCSRGKDGWWGKGVRVAQAGAGPGGEASTKGGSGSAFFISADGLAVTAAHVVKDCATVNSQRWGEVKVLATDPRADLAILKTPNGSGQFVALRGRGPKLGEAVSAGGYPLGGLLGAGLKITTGVVSGLSGPGGDRGLFQISASIQPGNSGGPVIDGSGALIGVTAAKLDELKFSQATGAFPQNVNFAVPVTILQSFLEENAVTYRTSGPAPAPAGSAGLSNYTFSVVCSR